MLELFVFNSVQRSGLFTAADLIIAPLKSGGGDGDMHLNELAETFNVHDTKCFRDVDRQTIFGIVETAGDGKKGFDTAVRSLARAAMTPVLAPVSGEMPPADTGLVGGKGSDATTRRRTASKGASPPPSPPKTSDDEIASGEEDEAIDLEAALPTIEVTTTYAE